MKHLLTATLSATLLSLALSGCMIKVDKDKNGEEKNVQVDTPFGHVHVNTDQTKAADLGLPVYPGAVETKEDGDNKSANVNVGFGEWEVKVKAISYSTSDSRDKVIDFYKKALSHYGTVIACKDDRPVGKPEFTDEGLTCSDDKSSGHIHVNTHKDKKGIEINTGDSNTDLSLKVGSKRHQHIMAIKDSSDKFSTHFALVALDLPPDSGNKDK